MTKSQRTQEPTAAEPTVRPKASVPGELAPGTRLEPDLSLEPEELARHFLTEAVQQGGNGLLVDAELELAVDEASPSDETTTEFQDEAETLWDATLSLSPRDESLDEGPERLPRRTRSVPLGERLPREDLDLTLGAIREGSLLDYEHPRSGRVRSPRLRTDEQAPRGRQREQKADAVLIAAVTTRRFARPLTLVAISLAVLALALPWLVRFTKPQLVSRATR